MAIQQMKTLQYSIAGIIFLLGCTFQSKSQSATKVKSDWHLGFNSGLYVYQGDLTPAVAGSWKTVKPGVAFTLSKSVNQHLSLQYALALATLEGDDMKYQSSQYYRGLRRFYFRSTIAELTVSHQFYFRHQFNRELRFQPYLSAGAGVGFLLNSQRSSSQTVFSYFAADNLRNKVAEDSTYGMPATILAVPVGLGFNYRLNDRLLFNMEGLYRFTSSDYLDGFSRSGNNKKNDYYYGLSVGIRVLLGKKPGSKTEAPVLLPVPQPAPVLKVLNAEASVFPDKDQDGIADSIDRCPQEKGTMEYYGCPAIPLRQPVHVPVAQANPETTTLPGFTIYFAYDRSSLDGAGFANLNEVIRLLKNDPALNVVLKGHTDMRGSVEANYKLSLGRSKVCADYLASYGIDRNRIKLEAYSKLQPVADPAEERLQWKNRRVEVVLEH